MKAIKTLLLIIAVIYGIITLGLTIFTAIDQTNIAIVEMLRTVYWFVIIPVPAFLVGLLIAKKWRISFLFVPTGVMILFTIIPSWLPNVQAAPQNPTEMSVLTFNILSPHDGALRIANIIEEANADIVALQELGDEMAEQLQALLGDRYPHQALHAEAGQWNYYRGVGIFSKYPILEDTYWRYDEFYIDRPEGRLFLTHGHMRVVIHVDGTEIVVYNTHPWAPFERHEGRITFLPETDESHSTTLDRVTDMAFAETAPVIFVGDLNMSDQFQEYRRLSERFTDSFKVVGQGIGFTYPACGLGPFPAFIRLDYIFHSSHFDTLEAIVLDGCNPSDHHPLFATISLK